MLVDRPRAQERKVARLGEGDLFGHPSMLSGLPTGFEVRAVEDTRCLRLDDGDALRPRTAVRPPLRRAFAAGAAGAGG